MGKRAATDDSANVPGTRMSTAFGLVIPDPVSVIPDLVVVIPAPDQVRGFNIRDPVLRRDWIAGQARNDSHSAA